jgi:thiol-disulfide isomerase/thioredoxin
MIFLATLLLLAPGLPLRADEPKAKPAEKLSLRELIERAEQSVVQITVLSANGEPLGLGSGFVIDAKGYVATNFHVTRLAAKALVQFRDGGKFDVKGYRALDREGDIAILELAKLPPKLKALPLGAKVFPRQGDAVIAIGHPQGLSFTVTTGIVSAVRKTSELPPDIRNKQRAPADRVWVQTSAAISSGNSGGPLLDEGGRVVGMNTWIADGQNLGFAIHAGHIADLLAKAPAKTIPLTPEKYSRDLDNPIAQPEPRIAELAREFQRAQAEFSRLVDQAKPKDEKALNKLWENDYPGPKYAKRFFEIADSDRKTTVAFQALWLTCQLDGPATKAPYLVKALDRYVEDHLADRGLHQVLAVIARTGHPAVPGFLRTVAAKSPHRHVRGLASYLLAWVLSGEEGKDDREAVRLLETCLKEYKDVPITGRGFAEDVDGKPLEFLAKPLLHRIRFLSVGKKATEIAGKDIDSKPFKLSDYKGKVVLLDFFADWCPHCVHMYPHERKLAADYTGRPFVILGVNNESKATLKQLIADKKVVWRCWWDGEKEQIGQEWQVDSFPTMYLLDHEGIIRRIFLGRPEEKELDKAIKDLVEKVPKAAPPAKVPGP